jgi:hypothetical protein
MKETGMSKPQREFLPMDAIQKIALLVDSEMHAGQLKELNHALTIWTTKGIAVRVVELNFGRKAEPAWNGNIRGLFAERSQRNWLGLPKDDLMRQLNDFRLDVLADLTENMTASYICGLSNARMRAGVRASGEERFYDLLIQTPGNTSLKARLHQLETYCNMLKK